MADEITLKALQDASVDAKSLEEVVNGDEAKQITTRKGETYPSVKKAIKTMFENGGLPATPFATKALMTASTLVDGKYAMVTEDAANNGLYVKTAGTWVKSAYDPAALAQTYTDNKVKGVTNNFKTKALMTASTLPNDSYAMVTEDTEANNGRYSKVAGAWVKSSYDPLKQAKTYADNVSWTAFDRKYTKPSTNLFNPKDALIGYSLHSTTGKEIANPDYISTGKIPVEAGVKYRVTGRFASMFVYDANDSFLSRHTSTSSMFEDSVTTMPPDSAYVRFLIAAIGATSESLDDNYLSISKGVEPIPYRKGYPTIDGLKLNDAEISDIKKEVLIDTRKEINLTNENIIDFKGNLFRADKSVIGKLIGVDGSEVEESNRYHTDFIPVEPDEVYTMSGVAGTYAFEHIAYYDKNKKFILRENSRTNSSESGEIEVVTPPNAYYAILNFQVSYPTEDERMFYKGVKGKEYSKPRLSREAKEAIYDSFSSDYLKAGINLISSNLVEGGFSLSPSSGAKSPSSSYGIVNFVPVEPDTLYTAKGGSINTAYYYDSNKLFIDRNILTGKEEFTTPSDAAFVRFLINNPTGGEIPSGQFLGKGSFDSGYFEVGHKQLTNLRLDNENIEDISVRLDPLPFILSNSPTSVYNNTADLSGYLEWNSNTPEQVYAMFDSLAQSNPNYITKQNLGVTSEGRELSVYKVSPARPSGALVTTPHYPKILIVGSIHGSEKLPALTLYLMLEQLCNNYSSSDMLELLRLNVEFVILPIANPDGWVGNKRKNANDVDLNRNFPSGFTPPTVAPDHEKYGGEEALQEVEAQLIHQLVQDNLDSNIGIDFHNFFGSDGTPIWLSTRHSTKMQALAKAHITRMSHKWRKDFDWFPDDLDYFAGYTTSGSGGGILSRHMHDSGITNSLTYEFSERWGDVAEGVTPYDGVSVKTAIESFVNFILMALHALENNKLH